MPTGLAHGTVTAVIGGAPVEVTTLRRDVATDGRRATIAFTEDWREDAARRDFTINALFADPASGEIFDYFGGLADLEARRVRFIGDPLRRIAEDHLRILRFFRFHARFGGGAPDPAGARSLRRARQRPDGAVARADRRRAAEAARPRPIRRRRCALMIARGIFRPVLPEIESADRLSALVERGARRRHRAGGDPPPRRPASRRSGGRRLGRRAAAPVEAGGEAARLGRRPFALPGAPERSPTGSAPPRRSTGSCCMARPGPETRLLESWQRPRLPVGGGDLVARGLAAGPLVAKTLQAIEAEWVERGFPRRDRGRDRPRYVDQALRSSQ